MKNELTSIAVRLQSIIEDLKENKTEVTDDTENEIISILSSEIIEEFDPNLDDEKYQYIKKALINMFIMGQLSPTS